MPFIKYLMPDYQVTAHSEKLAEALEGVANGSIKRLIVSMPPRHGKSITASIYFPAWYLGMHPNHRIISCSYSAELSHSFSRQCRNVVSSPEYAEIFSNPAVTEQTVELSADSRSVAMWDLAHPHRGGYVSAGVGGSITGKGANVLIIDDPVKDAEEARSETILENIWSWFTSTAYTRLQGQGAVILIMTRWSEDDLVGRVIRRAQEQDRLNQWTVLNIPALAEDNDPLGRQPGEALWPEQFPVESLEDIKFVLGERDFSALYQQRPAPAEGNIWKRNWWRYYDPNAPMPRFRRIIQVWDTAYKEGKENDYSACLTFGQAQVSSTRDESNLITLQASKVNHIYLLDAWRGKVNFPGLIEAMVAQYEKWASVSGCRPQEVIIEDKASGTSAYQALKHATNIPVISMQPDRDKVSRANSVTPWYQQGRIYHPTAAHWLEEYEHELETFPAAPHDDYVDPTTMGVERLLGRAGASAFLSYIKDQASGSARAQKNKAFIALPGGIKDVQGL